MNHLQLGDAKVIGGAHPLALKTHLSGKFLIYYSDVGLAQLDRRWIRIDRILWSTKEIIMKTKVLSRVGVGLAVALVLSGSAFANSILPAGYAFTLKGGGNLNKANPNTIWPCGWTFQARTTSSSGGTISGGVGDTNNNCSWITVQPTTFSITSPTTGVFHGLEFRERGTFFCGTSANIPFTIMKTGNNVTSFYFNYASFGNGCNFNANLNTGAALTVQ